MNKMKNLTGLFRKKRPNLGAKIMITKGGRTSLDESYNRLKDNVLHFGALGKKVLQVEASIAGEGKTTLVANLGVSLAFNDKKVVVIDLDFRNPEISKVFGVDEAIGVGDYVLEDAPLEPIIKSTAYGVDVITRGRVVYNSSFVLDSKKMAELIDVLKEKYDFILLDCPPVLMMSDYMHIAKYSDGILYTVSANFVKRSAVRDSLVLLSKLQVPIVGSVMTGVNPSDAFYGYSK
ncbi:MAG: CpsD/CapB family tyrosine-protein kinase [Clostridia bacterium]|nr:CpsD/CapB family tyrosine-protein kinase [Clostridia bacterium]